MRVLFVLPGEAAGSSMIFARRQAESLEKLGVEVHLFYLRSRTSPSCLVREWSRFRGMLRAVRPEVVHAHFGTVTAAFAAVAIRMGTRMGARRTPLVITVRGGGLNPCARPWRGRKRASAGGVLLAATAPPSPPTVCRRGRLRQRVWWP